MGCFSSKSPESQGSSTTAVVPATSPDEVNSSGKDNSVLTPPQNDKQQQSETKPGPPAPVVDVGSQQQQGAELNQPIQKDSEQNQQNKSQIKTQQQTQSSDNNKEEGAKVNEGSNDPNRTGSGSAHPNEQIGGSSGSKDGAGDNSQNQTQQNQSGGPGGPNQSNSKEQGQQQQQQSSLQKSGSEGPGGDQNLKDKQNQSLNSTAAPGSADPNKSATGSGLQQDQDKNVKQPSSPEGQTQQSSTEKTQQTSTQQQEGAAGGSGQPPPSSSQQDKDKDKDKDSKQQTPSSSPQTHKSSSIKTMLIMQGKFELMTGREGVLGEGSFSSVHRGRDMSSGQDVAIKRYKMSSKASEEEQQLILTKFKRQISVLKDLLRPLENVPECHRNGHTLDHELVRTVSPEKLFLRLLDYTKDSSGQPGADKDNQIFVVTEMADYSLKDYLRAKQEDRSPVSDSTLQYVAKNFVLSCAVLHAKSLVHLDIKPENIMRCGSTWKLIDVDGCTTINTKISINDSSISFSPCYCAPEWAHFLIEDADHLRVGDQLDVWSVGISLCELVMLDAVLKPKYASIYKHAGSHRKAGFLFLEWLSKREESLALHEKILNYHPPFVDMVVGRMLTKDEGKR